MRYFFIVFACVVGQLACHQERYDASPARPPVVPLSLKRTSTDIHDASAAKRMVFSAPPANGPNGPESSLNHESPIPVKILETVDQYDGPQGPSDHNFANSSHRHPYDQLVFIQGVQNLLFFAENARDDRDHKENDCICCCPSCSKHRKKGEDINKAILLKCLQWPVSCSTAY